MESAKRFEEKLARIHDAVGSQKPSVLARILGIDPASIAAAKKRMQIPGGWVETIAEKCDISANWLYFGYGSKQMLKHDSSVRVDERNACPRCLELYDKLIKIIEENGQNKLENIKLQAQLDTARQMCKEYQAKNDELQQQLSLSTDASAESAPAKTA